MTIGRAMRHARGHRTQRDVIAAMDPSPAQPTVSEWENDRARPTLEQIVAWERACGVPLGYVLRAAGYVDEARSTEDAIRQDPALTVDEADSVVLAYEAVRGLGARRRRH